MKKTAAGETEKAVVATLARNVEILRRHYGRSLAELARRADVSSSQTKHIAHGRSNPSLPEILGLANAFGVTVADLAGNTDWSMHPPAPGSSRYDAKGFGRDLGSRLHLHRLLLGMTVNELAERAPISRAALRTIELNVHQPGLRTLLRLAAGFDLSLAAFVDALQAIPVKRAPSPPPRAQPRRRTLLRDTSARDLLQIDELQLAPGQTVRCPASKSGSSTVLYVLEGRIRVAFARAPRPFQGRRWETRVSGGRQKAPRSGYLP